MPIDAGTQLGPHEILAPLGSGGMGEVYRARDKRLGRDVAVKVLPDHLRDEPQCRARFEREARILSALQHPHVAALYDVGHHDSTEYLVMELIDGESLADRVNRGPLPIADVLRIGAEIAEGLASAHHLGVVHRDLKPANVMLSATGAKLVDFGLGRTIAADAQGVRSGTPTVAGPLTDAGSIVSTIHYMSPEPLERYAADLVAPFEEPGDRLAEWYRRVRPRVPKMRLVFSHEEAEPARALLARHLERNVLGDDFAEDTFLFEPVHHVEMTDPALVARHIEAALATRDRLHTQSHRPSA